MNTLWPNKKMESDTVLVENIKYYSSIKGDQSRDKETRKRDIKKN